DHATALPFTSVMLTTVLLNVDWMWAMPVATFFFVFFFAFFAGAAVSGAAEAGAFFACFSAMIFSELTSVRRARRLDERQCPCADLCACGRWCACAARGPGGLCGDEGRGSNRGPSSA